MENFTIQSLSLLKQHVLNARGNSSPSAREKLLLEKRRRVFNLGTERTFRKLSVSGENLVSGKQMKQSSRSFQSLRHFRKMSPLVSLQIF
ncbi:hypothetical protein ASD50_03550 [Mesorhizobium sp. Root552]|nr:hypothetical protein ASD50_03550 [Mesorhizobium sp. Root552]